MAFKREKTPEKAELLGFSCIAKKRFAVPVQIDFSIYSLDIGLAKLKIIDWQLKESRGETIPDAKNSETPLSTGLTEVLK